MSIDHKILELIQSMKKAQQTGNIMQDSSKYSAEDEAFLNTLKEIDETFVKIRKAQDLDLDGIIKLLISYIAVKMISAAKANRIPREIVTQASARYATELVDMVYQNYDFQNEEPNS